MESNSTAFLIKIKLRHSLGRPSRSDFVQVGFVHIIYIKNTINRKTLRKCIVSGLENDVEADVRMYRIIL